jgi:hypothetical protein
MTSTSNDHSLSRFEIVVLACLSRARPPKESQLVKALAGLAPPDEPPERAVAEALAGLRARGLVTDRRLLTDRGERALRAVFDVGHTPTWNEVSRFHLPALALGLRPGSNEAEEAVRTAGTLTLAVLRAQLGGVQASTVNELCDTLIAEALGMPPGPQTLGSIRAHVLARRAGVAAKGTPSEIAKRTAAAAVGMGVADKTSMVPALARRWVREAGGAPGLQLAETRPVAPPPVQQPPPAQPPPAQPPPPHEPQPVPSPQTSSAEALLEVVRETIPRVGVDGRFGAEKVFVSAIWRSMERDHRLSDLSLDRFKRWLVSANRDGWLVLARADLVGAMDPKLVAESEIQDQGATFHFVLDHRTGTPGPGRGNHAR